MFQVIAMNGYGNPLLVERLELNESNGNSKARPNEVGQTSDEVHWKPEVEVMYDVDEAPPVSLCLLLGFQVSSVIM